MTDLQHQSVLFNESLDALRLGSDGIYIDGTFGRGGHTRAMLERIGAQGRVYAFDKDPEAIEYGLQQFGNDQRFTIAHRSFADLLEQAKSWDIVGEVDGILLDLGVSSPQLDDAKRGFSFLREGPLDMRMDCSNGPSAGQWLASASQSEIATVIKEYGEERYAKRIAGAIVKARTANAIETTTQLANIVAEAHPAWEKHKHPATRTFQAIRIFINQELEDLKRFLDQALEVLAPGGRLAVISFHSLEDRIVKQFIQKQMKGDEFPVDLPVMHSELDRRMKKIGKMQIPSEAELRQNPRARSAKLRVAEKL